MRKILRLFKCPQLWSSVVEARAKSNPTQVFPSLGETEASRQTPVLEGHLCPEQPPGAFCPGTQLGKEVPLLWYHGELPFLIFLSVVFNTAKCNASERRAN